MLKSELIIELQYALLKWFDIHARELPWRFAENSVENSARSPYRVWISEILLQQTQVSRAKLYFERFLTTFPDVHVLAAAPIEAVLKAWEGCGYYARARHLHLAAQKIVEQGFPVSYEAWLALPGIGPYTAAAISSITLGEARAVNDGNVRRVLARVCGELSPTPAWVQQQADRFIYQSDPGRWNEAIMDLGATICVPKAPQCQICPLKSFCLAYASGQPTTFPLPKERAKVRQVMAVALLVGDTQQAYLEQRAGTLLGGLWGLPLEEVTLNGTGEGEEVALKRLMKRLEIRTTEPPQLLGTVKHQMTHRQITLKVYGMQVENMQVAHLPLAEVASYPLSRLDHKALALYSAQVS